MDGLKELIKDCIARKVVEFKAEGSYFEYSDPDTRVISFIGIIYFVILENGEIKFSESETILDQLGIEFAFVLIKIYYTPKNIFYNSYLDPIIINRNLEVVEGDIKFDDWTFRFRGQFIQQRPTPINVDIINGHIHETKECSTNAYSDNESFHEFIKELKFFFTVYKYHSKTEAAYLKCIHRNQLIIDDLKQRIKTLEEMDYTTNCNVKS